MDLYSNLLGNKNEMLDFGHHGTYFRSYFTSYTINNNILYVSLIPELACYAINVEFNVPN